MKALSPLFCLILCAACTSAPPPVTVTQSKAPAGTYQGRPWTDIQPECVSASCLAIWNHTINLDYKANLLLIQDMAKQLEAQP